MSTTNGGGNLHPVFQGIFAAHFPALVSEPSLAELAADMGDEADAEGPDEDDSTEWRICGACGGCGQGHTARSVCRLCRGSGEVLCDANGEPL
jgi:hypothetical protein